MGGWRHDALIARGFGHGRCGPGIHLARDLGGGCAMNALSLTNLVSLDTRFWVGRATSLYCRASRLPLWLRPRVIMLALETHANIQSLRAVGPLCPTPPSLWAWGSTVALLFIVSPRLAVAALRLFAACYALRLPHYRAIGDGVVFTLSAALTFGVLTACMGAP